MRTWLAIAVTVVTLCLKAGRAWADDAPSPPPKPKGTEALVAGGVLFGGAYATSYAAAMYSLVKHSADCHDANARADAARNVGPGPALITSVDAVITCATPPPERFLFVPIAGPFLTLGEGKHEARAVALLVADATSQIVGLTLVTIGAVQHIGTSRVQIVPAIGSGMTGMTAFGSF